MKEETHRFSSIVIQAVTAIFVIIGGVVGLNSWSESQELEKIRLKNEMLAAFWDKRVEAHIDAATAAAILARVKINSPPWNTALRNFWKLYYGQLAVVEDYKVCLAMVDYRAILVKYTTSGKPGDQKTLAKGALKLAAVIRTSLRDSSEDLKPIAAEHDCN